MASSQTIKLISSNGKPFSLKQEFLKKANLLKQMLGILGRGLKLSREGDSAAVSQSRDPGEDRGVADAPRGGGAEDRGAAADVPLQPQRPKRGRGALRPVHPPENAYEISAAYYSICWI
ncbi:hypothetical protein L596_018944 [Steinernema carpocapsae]|uniref:SKP1 component POZ domain-containing protein n=1 Tax=Steinernema carpocapsae TaxID=34508 RepID=A0A4U5N6P7_STECR|nr:hypothetical protein L596_018944 [Steinernema carpocapsae]